MKLLTFIIAVLFVTVLATVLAIDDPGYVLMARAPWSIEMPLTLFALFVLLGGFAFYFSGRLMLRTWRLPRRMLSWRYNRLHKNARRLMNDGLLNLAEGNWRAAETALLADLDHSETPLLNYLAAAYAAQRRGDNEKRDEYLAKAHKTSPEGGFTIGMIQARLHYEGLQYEQTLAILSELRSRKPHHPYLLALLAQVYRDLHDWTALAELLPELRKRKAMPEHVFDDMELRVHRELMSPKLPSESLEVLERAWQTVPRHLQKHPEMISIYAARLIEQQQTERAEGVLRTAINRQWNDDLVLMYGLTITTDTSRQLKAAEEWLSDHPGSAPLLLTLGRLANETGHLDKARRFLDQAATQHENPEVLQEIGRILEKQGNVAQALTFYRHGLEATSRSAVTKTATGKRALGNPGKD